MTPQDVSAEVTASGLHGRGGAAFPVGRKWSFVNQKTASRTTCAATPTKASRERSRTAGSSSTRRTSCSRHADRRLRAAGAPCVRLHPRRVRPAASAGSPARSRRRYAAGSSASASSAATFACDIVVYRGAGAYVCGEESGLLNSLEGKQGLSAQPAAVPDRARPVPAADGRQQRRDTGQRRRDHRATAARPSRRSARRRTRARG